MDLLITGVSAWTAAGDGVQALVRMLDSRDDAFVPAPPYPAEGLARPVCAPVPGLDRERPAEALLQAAARAALRDAGLDPVPQGLGIVVGTSSGDISGPWERWHRARLQGEAADEGGTGRDEPTLALARSLGTRGPTATVSVACASGTAAFAVAAGWLQDGRCEAVLVAGVDALSLFIHAGFSGLGALSATGARPFSPHRDGLTLGEGAAALILERPGRAPARAHLRGVGLSSDATHLSAPHREGRGAAAAMRAALRDARVQPDDIDMVSLHGTATVFNDAMEARAVRAVFGERPVPVHGVKGSIGHTLGAAGAVEAAVCVHTLGTGRQPPPPPEIDPDCPLLSPPWPAPPPRLALSTSSAFGGSNAALVLGADAPAAQPPAPVAVRERGRASLSLPPGRVDTASLWPDAPARLRRMPRYSRAGVLVLRRLIEQLGDELPTDTGIVLASPTGCRAIDLRYHARLVERGAAGASRLDFIHTVPGTPAAEASILWDLRGPALVLVGPMEQAEDEARRLIRWGRARLLVALGVDAPADDQPAFASASLLEAAP